jgi:demethylmenaquinone methyltransferase / 2-methoxy-6-polyprenyl-1,4-benzoquinol methylase
MTAARDAGQVRAMFDRIAPGYDRANTLLSFGRDRTWRSWAADAAALSVGDAALDIACGSGKLTLELQGRVGGGRVVGLDFSEGMLAVARATQPSIEWVQGDATRLPFEDSSFDAATVAFGLRNLADPEKGLLEMGRVVRPGGRLVVLEFLRPPHGVVGTAYELYLRHLLPRLGGWVGGDRSAYRYLSDTVDSYVTGEQLLDLADHSGWSRLQLWRLNLSTVGLLRAVAG